MLTPPRRARHPLSLFAVAGPLLAAGVAGAQAPLQWKWAAGDTVRYVTTQTMDMEIDGGPTGKINSKTEQAMLMAWTVDAVDAAGEATIAQAYERITMSTEGPGGQGFEYDSASDEPPAGMASLVAPMFDALVESPIIAKMRPTGDYSDIALSDGLAESFGRLPGGGMSADTVAQMTKRSSISFPDRALAVGDTWEQRSEVETPQMGKMVVTTTYTYNGPKEIDGRTLESFTPRVDVRSPPGEGKPMRVDFKTRSSDGEILFDPVAGRVARSRIEQELDVVINVADRTINNAMTQITEMREVGPGETPALGAPPEASLAE